MDTRFFRSTKHYELDCQQLHYYFSGNGALNSQKLVEVMVHRKINEYKVICQTYNAMYGQDLLHTLSSLAQRNNNPFARAGYLRMCESHVRDAEIMRKSLMEGSLNLNTLIEVACTRSSYDLICIKHTYRSRYNSDLDREVYTKINGGYKEILLAVLKSCRNYNGKADTSMAMCDAKTLYEAIESGRTIDQTAILSLISHRNTCQLRSIFSSYKHLYGHEFSRSIKKRPKCGQFGAQLRIAIRCVQFPERFFAKLLRMKSGDSRELLIRVVICRSGIDLKCIDRVFAAKTGSCMESLVRREFSGFNCRNKVGDMAVSSLLVALIRG
ncbi:annexin D2-like [Senna tora]|uniref:Annexin D2-like n=1 Tax=Senna tora TaxID=362788 RepID=A0A834XEN2_9FABA|nr:annexin D2-like [Senna tora]